MHRRPVAPSKRPTNGQNEKLLLDRSIDRHGEKRLERRDAERGEGQLIWRIDGQDRQADGQADLDTDRQADRWTEGLRSLKTDGHRD